VVLLWGESAYLLREVALRRLARALGESRPVEVDAETWRPGLTSDLSTPSLLGEPRGLLVSGVQDLPGEAVEELSRYALEPDPEALLVLTATVSARAKGPPARLTKLFQGRAGIERVALDRKDLPAWLQRRAEARSTPADPAGIRALIETVGEDPAALTQAVVQLGDAFPEQGVTRETVAAQFRGFGDRRIWDLCDAAFAKDAPTALRALAAMLEAGDEPLAILGGIAARLRDLLRVRALPQSLRPAEAAAAAGLRFDWQARRYREQAARFTGEELAELHAMVGEADRLLKMGGTGDVVLPMLVSRIATEPGVRAGTR
jgi:DNA polymerase III subunit delta